MNLSEISIGNVNVAMLNDERQLLDALFESLENEGWAFAVAVNPEKVMAAQTDAELQDILARCTLRYADGIGVVKAVRAKTGVSIPRLPGCEVWELLMREAGEKKLPVFLVGATAQILEATRMKLIEQYETPVADYQDGYFENEAGLIQRIKQSGAKIITVAMGSPKQEKFIFKCREAGIEAIFMGVGGTYDVYTGSVKRAPAIWCRLGLEWLYRLLSQPTRWRRQLNLVKFLYLMGTKKL